MNISERLLTICELVTPQASLADIGADHGLVEKYLLDHELVERIVAVENKKGPFNILKNNLNGYENLRLSLSDGIEDIDEDTTEIIIAGMGGKNIINILNKHKDKLKNVNSIIIDSHTFTKEAREKITEIGFYIEQEKIVFENNKFYFIIKFLRGTKTYKKDELEWGFNIVNDKYFNSYKQKMLEKMNKNLSNLEKSQKSSIEDINALKAKIERLKNYGN